MPLQDHRLTQLLTFMFLFLFFFLLLFLLFLLLFLLFFLVIILEEIGFELLKLLGHFLEERHDGRWESGMDEYQGERL